MDALELHLQGFRRFVDETFRFERSTLFVGPNGAGKTTVLEALHYLSVGRSHRTNRDRELIGWDTEVAHLSARFGDGTELRRTILNRGTQVVQKRAMRNGVVVPLLESLGVFHVVLFAPELVELITGSPRARRRYIDILLASTMPAYARELGEYNHAVKQRNQLLFRKARADASLDAWEALLVSRGTSLTEKRAGVVAYLRELLPGFYADLTPGIARRRVDISYLPSMSDPGRYADLLVASRERDARLGATSIGPHRDDLAFTVEGRPAVESTSRGEQRSVLLALKRAELEFFSAAKAELPPLLLFDDMFSELDETRSEALAALITDHRALITATDATTIPAAVRRRVDVRETVLVAGEASHG